ncbi:hypothetical protein PM082_010059 [Marasmius tenuissimus]|nr:hypothetical protein PM082_010059 [Marasmius tenuissimus]
MDESKYTTPSRTSLPPIKLELEDDIATSSTPFTTAKRRGNISTTNALKAFYDETTENSQVDSQEWYEDICRKRGIESTSVNRGSAATTSNLTRSVSCRTTTRTPANQKSSNVKQQPPQPAQIKAEPGYGVPVAATPSNIKRELSPAIQIKSESSNTCTMNLIDNDTKTILYLQTRLNQEETERNDLQATNNQLLARLRWYENTVAECERELAEAKVDLQIAATLEKQVREEARGHKRKIRELENEFAAFKRKLLRMAEA